jgi:hypothetical protein
MQISRKSFWGGWGEERFFVWGILYFGGLNLSEMPIKVKTRKILWSKSGNRCALCKCQLVEKLQNHNSDFIVGEECHIISSKTAGPRGSITILEDYDSYDNLMLLCANHHKLIDEFPETYSYEILVLLKANHEKWIKETIDKDIEEINRSINNIEYLDRVTTWSQIDQIIVNSHFHFSDFSSINNKELIIELAEFFDILNEFSDIYSDIDVTDKTKSLISFEAQIKKFNEQGISIFGKRLIKEYKFASAPKSEYTTSMFVAICEDEKSNFIQNDKLIIKLPNDFTPTF